MAYNSFQGELLVGKSNFIEWYNNAKLFFEINGFMPYIDGTEETPSKELYFNIDKTAKIETPKSNELAVKYYEKLAEYNRNNAKSLGALKSIISKELVERFYKNTAYNLYKAIIEAFGESSLDLIGRYYNKLINANYSSYKAMDEYTSIIQSSSNYLKELKCKIPTPLLVTILFKGLPSSFEPLISRKYEEIGKDLENIDFNKLVNELIAEEARMSNSIDLEANKATKYYNKNNKTPYCTHCNKKGHLESKCYNKYLELKKTNNS